LIDLFWHGTDSIGRWGQFDAYCYIK